MFGAYSMDNQEPQADYLVVSNGVAVTRVSWKAFRPLPFGGQGILDERDPHFQDREGGLAWGYFSIDTQQLVLRIRDDILDPGSECTFFYIPNPGSKNLSILTQKLFLGSGKYDPGCSSRIRIFLPIPDPGPRKPKRHRILYLDRSCTWIRNTGSNVAKLLLGTGWLWLAFQQCFGFGLNPYSIRSVDSNPGGQI